MYWHRELLGNNPNSASLFRQRLLKQLELFEQQLQIAGPDTNEAAFVRELTLNITRIMSLSIVLLSLFLLFKL